MCPRVLVSLLMHHAVLCSACVDHRTVSQIQAGVLHDLALLAVEHCHRTLRKLVDRPFHAPRTGAPLACGSAWQRRAPRLGTGACKRRAVPAGLTVPFCANVEDIVLVLRILLRLLLPPRWGARPAGRTVDIAVADMREGEGYRALYAHSSSLPSLCNSVPSRYPSPSAAPHHASKTSAPRSIVMRTTSGTAV